jgi:ubiquinone/menaquinone biosynthesis C-methylase UbiE
MKTSWKKLEHKWRKQLLAYAKGNILEVGVGVGNNFKYYPMSANVTATDMSARVMEKAKAEAINKGIKATFIVSPVEVLQLKKQSFDTIVSTFSLSAYENPEKVLEQFNEWCKPDGMILLLEYGLSKYKIVSWVQKKWNPIHYKRTGSHINRDILRIITASGLHVKRVEVKYLGIVYLIWASLVSKPI